MSEVRLQRLLRPSDRNNRPDLQVLSVYRDHGVVLKGSRSDNFNKTPEDVSRYLHVRPGDLVVNKMKAWSGSVAVSRFEGIVSGDYLVCEVDPAIRPRYLHYLLRSQRFVGEMRIRSLGIRPNQERLYWEDLAEIAIPLPPKDEQRRIADFLDDRVARIDQIITARRQQVLVLEGLLAAEIETALDRLQEHTRASRVVRVLPGYAFPSSAYSTDESDVRLLRGINVGVGSLRWDEVVYWPSSQVDEVAPFRLKAGDLVMGMDRPWIGAGLRIAQLSEADACPLLLQRVAKIWSTQSSNRFLFWAYRSRRFQEQVEADLTGLSVPHLSAEQILSYELPVGSAMQQGEIAAALDKADDKLKSTTRGLGASVELLAEYKRSLITAAVTGELDVTTAASGLPK